MLQRILVAAAVVLNAGAAVTQEVRLISETARGPLNEASLLRNLDDDAVPQDYVAAARADYRRLLTALYAEGYYGGTISIKIDGVEAADLSPLAAPSAISNVVISVDAGPAFSFGKTTISPLPDDTILPEGFATGSPAEAALIKTAVADGLTSWRDQGYAKARVAAQQINARHADRALDVNVALDPGNRLTFGALKVAGNKAVSDARIREIAGLPSGAVYDPAEITRVERRLRRTGTFNSVALTEADVADTDDSLQITAQVAESKPRRFGFGLELSSIEGLTVSSFWLHRNLLGGAERFRIGGEVSGIGGETGGNDYAIRGSFNRPATFDADTDFFIRAEVSRENEPDYQLDKISAETGFTRIVRDDLTVEAGVGLLRAREQTDTGARSYTLFTLPLKGTLDRRDSPSDASEGYFLDLSITPFISIDGDVGGARMFADARTYRSFGAEEKLTLAARGQVGSVLGAEIDEAPADFLFHSGGGGTVRGQPYQSLAINRTIDGERVTTGGTSFAGAQLEARYEVRDKLSLVGFYDFGYVSETSTPLDNGDWHAGAGLGVRYDTGIGPIRLDIGTPASGDDVGKSVQVYIGIGQSF